MQEAAYMIQVLVFCSVPLALLRIDRVKISDSSSSSRLPNGHINFDKFWQLAKQVTEFMAWKQVTCPFEKVPDVINYMQTTAVLTETGEEATITSLEVSNMRYSKSVRNYTIFNHVHEKLP